jgi:hypothetical protein
VEHLVGGVWLQPDVWDGDVHRSTGASSSLPPDCGRARPHFPDVAIDFVDAATLVDRIRDAFFIETDPQACASTSTL